MVAEQPDTLSWRRAANLEALEALPDQETAMPASPTLSTEPCRRLQMVPGSDASGFQLRFRSLFHEGRGYSFPCDALGSVDMDRLSERARVNYLFARAMVGRDLHVAEVVAGDLHGSGADDVEPARRRPGMEH
jgi:hypothetical protein